MCADPLGAACATRLPGLHAARPQPASVGVCVPADAARFGELSAGDWHRRYHRQTITAGTTGARNAKATTPGEKNKRSVSSVPTTQASTWRRAVDLSLSPLPFFLAGHDVSLYAMLSVSGLHPPTRGIHMLIIPAAQLPLSSQGKGHDKKPTMPPPLCMLLPYAGIFHPNFLRRS